MSSATAAGWDTVTAWEASTSTVVEPARSAMNRMDSAGMARSRRVTIVQHDAAYLRSVIDGLPGPVVVAGHSYGGSAAWRTEIGWPVFRVAAQGEANDI